MSVTEGAALAALHQRARTLRRVQRLTMVVCAAGFGASSVPRDLAHDRPLPFVIIVAVGAAIAWGLPMWFVLDRFFGRDLRRALRMQRLVPADILAVRDGKHVTTRLADGQELVWKGTRKAGQLEEARPVWLSSPATLGETIVAVGQDSGGQALVVWPRGAAWTPGSPD